jgi:aryl-alcohol dehydrogenase-like predicted oxidoreductase
VDTADVYSTGESEEIVGKALKGRRDDVVLATKFFVPMGDDPNQRGGSRRWIITEVENSLKRLGTDWIDLYQVHRPDPETDVEETLSALTDLVQQGKVRYIGSSSYSAGEIVEAQWTAHARNLQRFRTEQPPYSILVRGIELDVLPTAKRHGMGHPHLQPTRRRLALRKLERRKLANFPGTSTTRRTVRHGATREPTQARSG